MAALPTTASEEERAQARLDADFPEHGAVTDILKTVHAEASGESPIVGWLRIGNQIRVAADARRGPNCD